MLSRKQDDTLAPHRLVPTRGLIRLVLLWGGVFHAGHPPGNAVTAATSNDSGTSLEGAFSAGRWLAGILLCQREGGTQRGKAFGERAGPAGGGSEIVAELKLRPVWGDLEVEVTEESAGPAFHGQLIKKALRLLEVVTRIKRHASAEPGQVGAQVAAK